ncbi:MAG: cyclic nucleotide-binding and patatin-like phospholipase domain-containing protein [Actinomycetota bacterium]
MEVAGDQLIEVPGRRSLAPGEVLCHAGDQLDAVYQVRSGCLSVIVDGPEGPLRVGELTTPAFIGEISALTGGLTTARVQADEATELAEIPLSTYSAWLAEHPEAAEAVANLARLRSNRSRTAALVADLTGIGDGEAVDRVIDLMTFPTLAADEVLFHQGDAADAAYIVVTGRVRVTAEADDDGRGEVDIELGRGALIGELGIIEDAPRKATIRAVRDTTLARIDRSRFEELAVRHPATVVRIVRTILLEARDGVPPLSRCRSVAIATTDPAGPAPEFHQRFQAEVARHGDVAPLSADTVAALLGRTAAAQATAGSLEQQRLSELLHEAEAGTDYLLFEIGPDLDAWSRRALRYTDRLLIVSSPRPDAAERARIEALVAEADRVPGVLIWIVTAYPAPQRQPSGAAAHLADQRVHDVLHIRPTLTQDVERLARLSTGNGVGVVFGGGGARGFAHIGALLALQDAGVPADALAGASMGAVFAGTQAMDIPPEELVALAERFFHKPLDYTLPVVALIKGAKVNARYEEFYTDWRLEDTWRPMACVSTNLTTSTVQVHRIGPMAGAIRASTAIPGALPPVASGGDLLVDGGVLDNLPADLLAEDDRVGVVIALDPTADETIEATIELPPDVSGLAALRSMLDPRRDAYPSVISTVIRSLLVSATRRRDEVLASGAIDLYIPYDLPEVGLLDFEAVASTARAGRSIATPLIEQWLAG